MISIDYSKVKILFVDCFDTIVFRKCKDDDVLEQWHQVMSIILGFDSELLRKTWNESISIVNQRQNCLDESSFNEVVENYYNRLFYGTDAYFSYDEFYSEILQKMIEIEVENDYLNQDIIEVIEEAMKNGLKIYCLSDFYLPQCAIEAIFEKLGIRYLFERIYVSSDEGCRKSTGKLYKSVLNELHLEPSDVMMIGDNKRSDYIIPQTIGLQAFLYKPVKRKYVKNIYNSLADIYYKNKIEGYPLSNYSFSLFLFCKKIHEQLKKRNFSKIYFFSREGECLKQLFDVYLSLVHDESIQTCYLYVSRRSTYLCALDGLEIEQFVNLKKTFTGLSLSQFLENIGLYQPVLECLALKTKYKMDVVIEDFWNSEVFKSFCREEEFITLYNQLRMECRTNFLDYLLSQGINLGDDVCVVDIGWKGTIQDNLSKLLSDNKIFGFYYGLYGDIELSNKNQKYGLVFSSVPYPNSSSHVYSVNSRTLERVLYASHGTCLGYSKCKPVLEEFCKEENELFQFVSIVQQRVVDDFHRINNVISSRVGMMYMERCFEQLHKKMILDVDRNKYRQVSFMNKRQKMSAGDSNNKMGYSQQCRIMARLLKHKKYIEFFNKIQTQLCDYRMFYIASFISKIGRLILNVK